MQVDDRRLALESFDLARLFRRYLGGQHNLFKVFPLSAARGSGIPWTSRHTFQEMFVSVGLSSGALRRRLWRFVTWFVALKSLIIDLETFAILPINTARRRLVEHANTLLMNEVPTERL
jgi:hypothetical protein